MLASRLGATPRTLYAPAVLESATAVATPRAESSIRTVLEAAAQVELAVVGIGSLGVHSSPHVLDLMALGEEEREAFEARARWAMCAAGSWTPTGSRSGRRRISGCSR
ncbi:sugar-binding domain-containing protein [Brachybacterium sp. GPGPB12]|uniref:sugar-binding domain-containing protein n=1 Tax=Brachybacterium sp. GPGPB12 TaxID=3023517 RepID=UPI003134551F